MQGSSAPLPAFFQAWGISSSPTNDITHTFDTYSISCFMHISEGIKALNQTYYICIYKYKYTIQIHDTSVIYSLFRMAPWLIFTFTLVIVERDTAKVYILQNWTSGDPDHFPE